MDHFPLELLYQVCATLDRQSVASLCLASRELHRILQPHLLRTKGSLDRAYKWSVVHGNVSLFRQVVNLGKYANISAMCLAAKHGQMGITQELLQDEEVCNTLKAADSAQFRNWGHPLTTAVKAGHKDIIRLFLDLPGIIDLDQVNAQKYCAPLLRACRRADGPEILSMFIERGVDLMLLQPSSPTLFIDTLTHGTWATASRLKEAGAADGIALDVWLDCAEQMQRREGDRGLRRLYLLGPLQVRLHPTQLLALLQSGLDLSFIEDILATKPDLTGEQGLTLLKEILRRRQSETDASAVVRICQMLVECGAKLDDTVHFRDRVLQMAARQHSAVTLLEILLQVPACPSPSTALGWVRTTEAARLLLSRGADINARNRNGEAPLVEYLHRLPRLTCVCENKDMETTREMVSLFLSEGAGPSVVSVDGYHTLERAMSRCSADTAMLQLLMDHGAKIAPGPDDPTTFRHLLPNVMQLPRDRRVAFASWLLDQGALLHGRDPAGYTTLFGAAKGLDADLLRLLLQRGANIIGQPNEDGWEPILQRTGDWVPKANHYHACWEPVDVKESMLACTRILLDAGARLRADDATGVIYFPGAANAQHLQMYFDAGFPASGSIRWRRSGRHMPLQEYGVQSGTLLHYAVEKHDVDFVQLVLEQGVDRNVKNEAGLTAWQHAVQFWGQRCGLIEELQGKPSTFVEELRQSAVDTELDEPMAKE